MSDVELRVVHEPDDDDPFGCVIECHDHREPTVEELLQALAEHKDTPFVTVDRIEGEDDCLEVIMCGDWVVEMLWGHEESEAG